MRIDELLSERHRPVFSFEFFPPKTEDGLRNLFHAVGELRSLRPDYVSVTYGAGGSTATKTIEIV
ncbi:MAG: methylenetetrahydrofolate reductase, partial [Solirubrobacteraceae bacterium]|nr:methylenetetrahydrofolate reductase [Solirubrobacteraceae bacterium]